MITKMDRSTGPHPVERWSEDTHYCPDCQWIFVHANAFRRAVEEAFGQPAPWAVLMEAVDVAARGCRAPLRGVTWVCDRCWAHCDQQPGFCHHNRRIAGKGGCCEGR